MARFSASRRNAFAVAALPEPDWGTYGTPPDPTWWGEGLLPLLQIPTQLSAFGLAFRLFGTQTAALGMIPARRGIGVAHFWLTASRNNFCGKGSYDPGTDRRHSLSTLAV